MEGTLPRQQHGLPTASQLADCFGFVTPEDRARWEQARQYSQPRVSAAREMITSSLEAAAELAQQGIQAKLRAAYQVEAQQKERSRTTARTVTEVVDFEDRDDRREIDQTFEF
ncbi:hypothetical protein ACFOY4_01690 [Actinomadura syzygii]|uniref:Uncharacterized protein n=1 Tax=Actinomadura syzygii TaxID=1427538 RepID=A0A5D0TT74_9ACTN|nr:hypothetical protein [Actinomadura syzygii]TYC08546.1 hypothetical protein FXF65_37255 [Actinomadura syzygii]